MQACLTFEAEVWFIKILTLYLCLQFVRVVTKIDTWFAPTVSQLVLLSTSTSSFKNIVMSESYGQFCKNRPEIDELLYMYKDWHQSLTSFHFLYT